MLGGIALYNIGEEEKAKAATKASADEADHLIDQADNLATQQTGIANSQYERAVDTLESGYELNKSHMVDDFVRFTDQINTNYNRESGQAQETHDQIIGFAESTRDLQLGQATRTLDTDTRQAGDTRDLLVDNAFEAAIRQNLSLTYGQYGQQVQAGRGISDAQAAGSQQVGAQEAGLASSGVRNAGSAERMIEQTQENADTITSRLKADLQNMNWGYDLQRSMTDEARDDTVEGYELSYGQAIEKANEAFLTSEENALEQFRQIAERAGLDFDQYIEDLSDARDQDHTNLLADYVQGTETLDWQRETGLANLAGDLGDTISQINFGQGTAIDDITYHDQYLQDWYNSSDYQNQVALGSFSVAWDTFTGLVVPGAGAGGPPSYK